MLKFCRLVLAVTTVWSLLSSFANNRAVADTAVPISYINFSGPGSLPFTTGTFVVPDQDTTRSAYGGALRRYDVHVAKMIELTAHQWCGTPRFQGVDWLYEADNRKVFMGKFTISCNLARQMVETYGLGRPEQTLIHHRGQGPMEVWVPVLNLEGNKIPQFLQFIQTLRPTCIDSLCPGDRLP